VDSVRLVIPALVCVYIYWLYEPEGVLGERGLKMGISRVWGVNLGFARFRDL
jgi:hypothetical protein